MRPFFSLAATVLAITTGCAQYATPGRPADLAAVGVTPEIRANQTEAGITDSFAKRPLAQLPTGIAVARLQAPDYHSQTAQGWGTGRYSIVTTRDVEPDSAVDRLAKLPKVHGVAPISRMLLPATLNSDKELRQAAAQLHADMLLVYTLDTSFTKNDLAVPLTVVTLGLSPNQKANIVSTASAVLLDTRNGYVYGVAEASSRSSKLMGAWGSTDTIDESRRQTETDAFTKLVGEVEKMWTGVLTQFPPS